MPVLHNPAIFYGTALIVSVLVWKYAVPWLDKHRKKWADYLERLIK